MSYYRKFLKRDEGSVLIFVLVVATIIGGATFVLLERANTELNAQVFERDYAMARSHAFSALEIARNAIDTSSYDDDNHNVVLWSADSSADGVPGNYIVDNGICTVRVNYLGQSWYELTARATVGEITREIKQRVRERDYFSRFGLFIADGDVRIGDTTTYYGAVHVNKNVVFADDVAGVGAECFGMISSTLKFTFNGNAQAETHFYAGYADQLGSAGWIDMPEVTEISELKNSTGAWGPSGSSVWLRSSPYAEFRRGPGGFSIVGNVYTYIEFINSPTERSKVRITIKNTSNTTLYTGVHDLPNGGVIHVGSNGSIRGLKGDVNGRVTVCSEEDIHITADVRYEDDNDQYAMIFDPANPGNDNYLPNPAYTGNSALGLIAARDILYTGVEDDKNLEVNAAMIAITGAIKWSGTADKDHLRVFGARCSDNQTYRCSGGTGYNDSGVYVYDERMRINPPPKFLTVAKPLYVGLEIVK